MAVTWHAQRRVAVYQTGQLSVSLTLSDLTQLRK
jgi:hypothetical protein